MDSDATLSTIFKPLLTTELGETYTKLLLVQYEPRAMTYFNLNTIQWMQLTSEDGETHENIVSTQHYCEQNKEAIMFYLRIGLGR
jgi:hypothetical protein